MRLTFNPQLVNDPYGDPGVYVDFNFEHRAFLFDLGDLAALPPKKLLRVTEVFVSHTHMDHFFGFDRLLRVCLGRHAGLRLYGPPGFVDHVGHRLAAYTWNLVQNYPVDFVIEAWETDTAGEAAGARFRCHAGFAAEALPAREAREGVLLDEPGFRVCAVALEHRTTSLAYAIEEKTHWQVLTDRLEARDLPSGPWLTELKRQVQRDAPPQTPLKVAWHDRDGTHERTFTVGELRDDVLAPGPGEKIVYVTDLSFTEDNARRVAALARGADRLFIECVFLHADAEQAQRKCHLTARQAGALARRAGAKAVIPFHFSPRYTGREGALRAELEAAFAGDAAAG